MKAMEIVNGFIHHSLDKKTEIVNKTYKAASLYSLLKKKEVLGVRKGFVIIKE